MAWMIFVSLTLMTIMFVIANGKDEERLAISVMVAGFVLTWFFYHQGDENWLKTQWSILAVDSLALLIFLAIALRSKRFWPLPIAALQLLPVLTPLVALFGENVVSDGLGVTQGVWGYLQLAILVIAANRTRKSKAVVPTK